MSYDSNVFGNINSLEGGKFVEIQNDARFPAISVNRVRYRDNGAPLTAVDIYPKYAVVTYLANASDISGGGGGGTVLSSVSATITNQVSASIIGGSNLEVIPANITAKFREAFETYSADSGKWSEIKANGDIIQIDGNAAAASYLVISKNPLLSDSVTTIETLCTFRMPFEVSIGIHTSQRTLGQEFAIELVSTETPISSGTDIGILGIVQTTTTLTITAASITDLLPGTRIGIRDVFDSRLNYPALVVANVLSGNVITCTAGPGGTIASVTTTSTQTSGFIYKRSALGFAQNGTSMILENATVTNASYYVRSESGDVLPSGTITTNHSVTILTTAGVQAITAPLTYAFQPTNEFKLTTFVDGIQWSDSPIDTIAAANSRYKRTQVVPNISKDYKFRIRATNNKSLTVPNALILSAAKTGTTTATIVTDGPHGLVTNDLVVNYGISNQTASAFPNITTATVVTAVDAQTFQIVQGSAATTSGWGGYVAKVQGGNLMSALGALTMAVLSTSRINNVVTLIGSATWSGVAIGDYINIVGCRNSTTGALLSVDGPYRVRTFLGSTLDLDPLLPSLTGNDIPITSTGGAVIKRTDLRVSFVRIMDFERQRVEMLSRPSGDISTSIPVAIQNVPAVTISSGTVTTVTGVGSVTNVLTVSASNYALNSQIIDVAAGSLTTTTTVTSVPTAGTSYQVTTFVTSAAGTNATFDLSVEESDDTSNNWYRVYDFPRISLSGAYRSPKLFMTGNRIRYIQTVGGTAPNFVRNITRIQSNDVTSPIRQLIDRVVPLSTITAASSSVNTQNCRNAQLNITLGASVTAGPVVILQGTDDFGLTWYSLGTPLTGVPNSTVTTTVVNTNSILTRAVVLSAAGGSNLSGSYVLIKGF